MSDARVFTEVTLKLLRLNRQFVDPATFLALESQLMRALAACDEPCVWKFSGPIRYPACRANEPWAAEIVEQFACCPYCGRKIKEADDDDA